MATGSKAGSTIGCSSISLTGGLQWDASGCGPRPIRSLPSTASPSFPWTADHARQLGRWSPRSLRTKGCRAPADATVDFDGDDPEAGLCFETPVSAACQGLCLATI